MNEPKEPKAPKEPHEPLVDPTTYRGRIVRDPNILVGKPTVKGTRISVELVLHFLASDPNLDELFAAYPRLTVEDVKAVLAYARAVLVGQEPMAHPLVTDTHIEEHVHE